MLRVTAALALLAACAAEPWRNPCKAHANSGLPFCDTRLPVDQRVRDLVDRVPASAYKDLLSNSASGVPALNILPYQWWSEALHGVASSPGVVFDSQTPYATMFPQVIGTGATFNYTLPNAIARVIATEARAFANLGHGAPAAQLTPSPPRARAPPHAPAQPASRSGPPTSTRSGTLAGAAARRLRAKTRSTPPPTPASSCRACSGARTLGTSRLAAAASTTLPTGAAPRCPLSCCSRGHPPPLAAQLRGQLEDEQEPLRRACHQARHAGHVPARVPRLRRRRQRLLRHVLIQRGQRRAVVRQRGAAQRAAAPEVGVRRLHHQRLRRGVRRAQQPPVHPQLQRDHRRRAARRHGLRLRRLPAQGVR